METEQTVRNEGLRIVDAFVATRTKLEQFQLDIEQQRPFLNPKAQESVGAAISDLCKSIRGQQISESLEQWRTTKPDEEWFEFMFEYGSTADLEYSMPEEQMAFNLANLANSLLFKFQDDLYFVFGVGLGEFEYRWQSDLRKAVNETIDRLSEALNALKVVPQIRSEIQRRAVGKLSLIDQGSDLDVAMMKNGLIGCETLEVNNQKQINKFTQQEFFSEQKNFFSKLNKILEQNNSADEPNSNGQRGRTRRKRRKAGEQKLTSQGLAVVSGLCAWHEIEANGKDVSFNRTKPAIKCREMERELGIPAATASEQFKAIFGSHEGYVQKWVRNPEGLAYQLAMLNGEVFCLGADLPENEDATED